MTIRVTEKTTLFTVMSYIQRNRQRVDTHSRELATGLKVFQPGDSSFSGTISEVRSALERIESHAMRVESVKSTLSFQDEVVSSAVDLMIRAKEIAAQGSNETNSETERFALSEEVFQLRDHLVSLANSRYQGNYIYGGAAGDSPPFTDAGYLEGDGGAAKRYVYPEGDEYQVKRKINVTDNLQVEVNTPGGDLFNQAIWGLERLGRALRGYRTEPDVGAPDGTGVAYVLPDEFSDQTADIRAAMDMIDAARESVLQPERVNVAGRLRRVETAESLLELSRVNLKEVLSKLQDADMVDSASNLSVAQTALEASMVITSRVMNLSILNYL